MEDVRTNKGWDETHDQALRDLVAEGLSYGLCADRLNKMFRDKSFTRNSCIGRAQRIKLSANNLSGYSDYNRKQRKKKKKAVVKVVPKPAPRPPAVVLKNLKRPASRPVQPSIPAPDCTPVSFDDLESRHCRYIVSEQDQEILFCGGDKVPESSYCEYHRSICVTNQEVRRK